MTVIANATLRRLQKTLIASLLTLSAPGYSENSTVESSQTPPSSPTMSHVSTPTGKVLPQGVERVRMLHVLKTANSGYDSHGKIQNVGLRFLGAGTALVAEYGVTPSLSFQFLAPYTYQNQLVMNKEEFAKSQVFASKRAEFTNKAAAKLAENRLCANKDACAEFIRSGGALPFDMALQTDDTGEFYIIKAGQSLQQRIDEQILSAAEPVKNGQVGLGDVETGLLYNLYQSNRFYASTGLGMRFPTGVAGLGSYRPSTGRIYDLGLRFNFDYSPIAGLWLGLQSQFEHALSKGRFTRLSVLDKTKANSADPSEGGDGIPNSTTYEKRDISQEYLVKANLGLGVMTEKLKAVGFTTYLTHREERPVYIGGKQSTKRQIGEDYGVSGVVSGLPYKLPVELELKYQAPLAGQDRVLAMSQFESVVYVYARF